MLNYWGCHWNLSLSGMTSIVNIIVLKLVLFVKMIWRCPWRRITKKISSINQRLNASSANGSKAERQISFKIFYLFFIDPHIRESTSLYLPCISCNQYNIVLMSFSAQLTIVFCRKMKTDNISCLDGSAGKTPWVLKPTSPHASTSHKPKNGSNQTQTALALAEDNCGVC